MRFNIMDYTGHTTLDFDKCETALAMEKFEELVKTHTAAQRNNGERDYTVTKDFKQADETLFVPKLQGG